MTQAEIKLCSLLLREHFGEIVEKVGTYLVRTGSQPLRAICADTGLALDQVRKALCVLIQHNLAAYQLQKRGCVEYEARCRRVLRILRYPRYIYTAKALYGDTGELLVEELLLNGKMTLSAVVRKVADRLTETMEGGRCSPSVRGPGGDLVGVEDAVRSAVCRAGLPRMKKTGISWEGSSGGP
ncbi:DNA-directed RNA polymerase III subunit RPC3-like [Phasianus colchicus]|uniref:DNA-directed RNA polymerase III subunit RPC3 n=1 Tax=Phasianus colchicus TaxID=9054 RepID=A0A669QXQ2_PHACC|nr:DNA-directed RNA polymerase III subunit RPC3-like [Phasianus colchicus]